MKTILEKVRNLTKNNNIDEIHFNINKENNYVKIKQNKENGQIHIIQPTQTYKTQKEIKKILENILKDESIYLITTTLKYKDNNTKKEIIETITYNNKQTCIKETLKKRKQIKEQYHDVNIQITNYGTLNKTTQNKINDVTFAEMPLHV